MPVFGGYTSSDIISARETVDSLLFLDGPATVKKGTLLADAVDGYRIYYPDKSFCMLPTAVMLETRTFLNPGPHAILPMVAGRIWQDAVIVYDGTPLNLEIKRNLAAQSIYTYHDQDDHLLQSDRDDTYTIEYALKSLQQSGPLPPDLTARVECLEQSDCNIRRDYYSVYSELLSSQQAISLHGRLITGINAKLSSINKADYGADIQDLYSALAEIQSKPDPVNYSYRFDAIDIAFSDLNCRVTDLSLEVDRINLDILSILDGIESKDQKIDSFCDELQDVKNDLCCTKSFQYLSWGDIHSVQQSVVKQGDLITGINAKLSKINSFDYGPDIQRLQENISSLTGKISEGSNTKSEKIDSFCDELQDVKNDLCCIKSFQYLSWGELQTITKSVAMHGGLLIDAKAKIAALEKTSNSKIEMLKCDSGQKLDDLSKSLIASAEKVDAFCAEIKKVKKEICSTKAAVINNSAQIWLNSAIDSDRDRRALQRSAKEIRDKEKINLLSVYLRDSNSITEKKRKSIAI